MCTAYYTKYKSHADYVKHKLTYLAEAQQSTAVLVLLKLTLWVGDGPNTTSCRFLISKFPHKGKSLTRSDFNEVLWVPGKPLSTAFPRLHPVASDSNFNPYPPAAGVRRPQNNTSMTHASSCLSTLPVSTPTHRSVLLH